MAAGFHSPFFLWVGGISAPTGTPSVGCPCPPWKNEQTLANVFVKEQTLANAFRKDQTLTNQWQRKACE